MDANLYDTDILTWSEQQANALRDLATRHPELSNAIDWDNLIEEVQSVGRSEFKAVKHQLTNALIHILKGYCDITALALDGWARETDNFLQLAREDYRPSMKSRIDLDAIWKEAFRKAADDLVTFRRDIPPGLPKECPFRLDEILRENFTFESAVRALQSRFMAPSKLEDLSPRAVRKVRSRDKG